MILRLALALLVSAVSVTAQEATEATEAASQVESSATDETTLLLERAKATDVELLEITREIPDAQGEDLVILRTRFSELGSQQRRELFELLGRIAKLADMGEDVGRLEQQVHQLLGRASRRLRSYISSFAEDLHQEGLRREALTPVEAEAFEHQMAIDTDRLDHLYLALVTLTDRMEILGMPVEDEREFLDTKLTQRGKDLLEILQLTGRQLSADRDRLRRTPDDYDLQARVFASEERFDSNKTALLATIHMMKVSDLPYLDLEVRTLELTGELTPEALDVRVASGLFQRTLARVEVYLTEKGPRLLLRILMVVGILAAFWIIARVARSLIRRALARKEIATSKLLEETLVSMTGRVIMILGIVFVLSRLGISLGPILAGLGIVGFIVGFALQDTLGNFASGVMILAYRPFDVGDFVEAAGVQGNVRHMNLVSTTILTPDHQTLIVPNSKVWGDVIRNVTARSERRVDMVFGISYEDEIPEAERVLAEIVGANEKVLEDPAPVIRVHTLNDSSVDFVVRPWTRTENYWDVYWDITREVKMRFDEAGISIPYPQRDVHLHGDSSESTAESEADTSD